MHRPNADPDNMTMADFLCDFCHTPWAEEIPMVEGHQGALICGNCLKVAYVELLIGKSGFQMVGEAKCRLCLEERKTMSWQSPKDDAALACERCVRQACTALAQDETSGWTKPA